MPQEEMFKIAQRCKLGLIMFLPKPNHITSQPNKLFEYMYLGLPILASDFPLWEKVIFEKKCGNVCNPEDSDVIAQNINNMLQNHFPKFTFADGIFCNKLPLVIDEKIQLNLLIYANESRSGHRKKNNSA